MSKRLSYTVNIKDKANGLGLSCARFEIKIDKKRTSLDVECIKGENSIDVKVPENGGCLYGFATCYDSKGKVTCIIPIKVCPCDNNSMCDNSQNCVQTGGNAGECQDKCNAKSKKNVYNEELDSCGECGPDTPCPKGTVCTPVKQPDGTIIYECIGTPPPPVIPDCGGLIWNGEMCCECEKQGDCDGEHEECDGCYCDCKDGYHRDPVTKECVKNPDCEFDTDCEGDCEFCDSDNKCKKDQDQLWVEGDPIPNGYGVINGCLVECNTLECDKCALAVGCECNDDTCEGDDCNEGALTLVQEKIAGTPGQPSGGKRALRGSADVTSLELVAIETTPGSGGVSGLPHSFIRNQEFAITINDPDNCMESGNWYYSPQAGTEVAISAPPVTASQATVTFKLSDAPINYNQFGFYVFFRDNNGREARFRALFNQDDTVPNGQSLQIEGNWNVVLDRANSSAGQLVGGTPDVCKIKVIPSNWSFTRFVGANALAITPANGNTLDVTFSIDPNDSSCLIYQTQGCGIWNGTAELVCKGRRVTVEVPTIEIDEALCCEGADCGGTGNGCEEEGKVIDISDYILAFPLFGLDNEYSLQIQVSENGNINGNGVSPVSFEDLWNLGASINDCWTQDSEQITEGAFGDHEELSQIYSEVSLNTQFPAGITSTEICFGSECFDSNGVSIGNCRKIQGCKTIDICDTASMIVYDKNSGEIINSATYETQANQVIEFVAIYSFPSAPGLQYIFNPPTGVTVTGGPSNFGNGILYAGTITAQSGSSGNLDISVDSICEVNASIIFEFECPEIKMNIVQEAGSCGTGLIQYQLVKVTDLGEVNVNDSYDIFNSDGVLVDTSSNSGSGGISDLDSGTYTFSFTSPTSDCPGSTTVVLDFGEEVTAAITGTEVCPGANASLQITGTPGATVTYNAGGTPTTQVLDSAGNAIVSIPNVAVNTTVQITNIALGDCNKNVDIQAEITVKESLSVGPIQVVAPDNLCQGDSVTLFVPGSGMVSVNIISGPSGVTIGNFSAGANHLIPGLPVGTYVLEIASVDGASDCDIEIVSGQASFTIAPAPSYTENLDCFIQGGVINVNDTYNVTGVSSVTNINIPTGLTVSPIVNGMFSVTGTVPTNTAFYSLELVATGNSCDNEPINRTLDCDCDPIGAPGLSTSMIGFCVGDPITSVMVSNNTGLELCVLVGGFIIPLGTAVNTQYTPQAAGVHQFYLKDGACESEFATLNVVEYPAMNILTQQPQYDVCLGEDITLNFAFSGGTPSYTFLWTGPNGQSSTDQNPVISGAVANDGGTWEVIVTDANGCTITGSLEVVVEDCTPPCELNVTVDTTDCFATQLTGAATGGDGNYTFSWIKNGDSNNPITGATITGLVPEEACDLILTVIDGEGCQGEISLTYTPKVCETCNFIFLVDNSNSVSSSEFAEMEQSIINVSNAINSASPASTFALAHYATSQVPGGPLNHNFLIETQSQNGPITVVTEQPFSFGNTDYLQPAMTSLDNAITNGDFNFADSSLPCKVILFTDAFGTKTSLIADQGSNNSPLSYTDNGNGGSDAVNTNHSIIIVKYPDSNQDDALTIPTLEGVAGAGNVYETAFNEDPTDDILDNLNCDCD
jgi:hypothetical protein